jgi:hypothetical protein
MFDQFSRLFLPEDRPKPEEFWNILDINARREILAEEGFDQAHISENLLRKMEAPLGSGAHLALQSAASRLQERPPEACSVIRAESCLSDRIALRLPPRILATPAVPCPINKNPANQAVPVINERTTCPCPHGQKTAIG